jgi:hypothetical protein
LEGAEIARHGKGARGPAGEETVGVDDDGCGNARVGDELALDAEGKRTSWHETVVGLAAFVNVVVVSE